MRAAYQVVRSPAGWIECNLSSRDRPACLLRPGRVSVGLPQDWRIDFLATARRSLGWRKKLARRAR